MSKEKDKERHSKLRDDLAYRLSSAQIAVINAKTNLAEAEYCVKYILKLRATYFLVSTVTLWVKLSKEVITLKINMKEAGNFVKRSMRE